ncbi:MAG: C-type lectin domain-containing protein [Myxococcota bacterium]
MSRRLCSHVALWMVLAAHAGCIEFDRRGIAAGSEPDGGADANAACPTMEQYVLGPTGDHCYRVVTESQVYDQAVARCAADGAYLAVIDSREENDFVSQLAASSVWIGHDDLAVEGMYTWVNGSNHVFASWNGERPVHAAEDCVVLESDGRWEDRGCGETFVFVCEYEPATSALAIPACMDAVTYNDAILAGRRYRLVLDGLGWHDARDVCAADGADLVAIADDYENELLRGLSAGSASVVWIGYSDIAREETWVWVNGAEQMTYQPWSRGEPNNTNGNEDCAEMLVEHKGIWNDGVCTTVRDYACECDPLAVQVAQLLQ